MCWKENNGGKNDMLEKFRDEATWKIANLQRQIHTHFRNFNYLHKHIFIHSHPIVLSWSSKEAGQGWWEDGDSETFSHFEKNIKINLVNFIEIRVHATHN